MGIHISGRYLGTKRIELKHSPTGSVIITDAPKDNAGEGTTFSPTDLLAAALGSCMLTVMSIYAERKGINLAGMRMEVEKNMTDNPRRIASLPIKIYLPKHLSTEERVVLERTAHTCPVHHSLHPDIKDEITFVYE